MPDVERDARRSLAWLIDGGDPLLSELVAKAGAVEALRLLTADAQRAATSDDPWTRRVRSLDVQVVRGAEARAGMRFLIPSDADWPEGLRALDNGVRVQKLGGMPVGLWVRGARSLAETVKTSVAIVGSRASSPYGDRVASDLAGALAGTRVTVVSGGAYGIDAAAHRGSLGEDGLTVCLLACGADEMYPRANTALIQAIGQRGLVVSEYAPGTHPTRPRFLARNRLIAALSLGTVLVEAGARSGARNTASWTTAMGRPLMAIPGPIGNSTSYMPHRLIREGEATLVTSLDEILEQITPIGTVDLVAARVEHLLDFLTDEQRAIYEALPVRGTCTPGELAGTAGLSMVDCLTALEELAASGMAKAVDGRWKLGPVSDRPLVPSESRPARRPSRLAAAIEQAQRQ